MMLRSLYDTDLSPFDYESVNLARQESIDHLVGAIDHLDVLVLAASCNLPYGLPPDEQAFIAEAARSGLLGPTFLTTRLRLKLSQSPALGGGCVVNTGAVTQLAASCPRTPEAAQAELVESTARAGDNWAGLGVRVNSVLQAGAAPCSPASTPRSAAPTGGSRVAGGTLVRSQHRGWRRRHRRRPVPRQQRRRRASPVRRCASADPDRSVATTCSGNISESPRGPCATVTFHPHGSNTGPTGPGAVSGSAAPSFTRKDACSMTAELRHPAPARAGGSWTGRASRRRPCRPLLGRSPGPDSPVGALWASLVEVLAGHRRSVVGAAARRRTATRWRSYGLAAGGRRPGARRQSTGRPARGPHCRRGAGTPDRGRRHGGAHGRTAPHRDRVGARRPSSERPPAHGDRRGRQPRRCWRPGPAGSPTTSTRRCDAGCRTSVRRPAARRPRRRGPARPPPRARRGRRGRRRPPARPHRSRSAARAIASTSRRARTVRRRASSPTPAATPRAGRPRASSSSMPSPVLATVLSTGGRQAPSRRSAIVSMVRSSRAGAVGALAVGLVDGVHVADLEDARLRGLDAVAHARREQHERGVGEARPPRPRSARRRRSRRPPRRSRPRRARAPPAGSTTPGRRGGRGRPSSGCRRRGRARGRPSAPGRRAARRPRTGEDGSMASTPTRLPARRIAATSALVEVDLPTPGAPVMPRTWARPACGSRSAAITSRRSGEASSTSVISRATAAGSPSRARATRSGTAWAPRRVTPRVTRSSRRGHADDQRVALAAAAAQRGGTDAATAALELEGEVQHDPGARHADGVAEGDGAAVDVDLGRRSMPSCGPTRCRRRRRPR